MRFREIKRYNFLLLIIIAIFLVGCTFTENKYPSIKLDINFVDLGEFNASDGKIVMEFSLNNEGTAPLEIYGISTSCGCTNAKLDSNIIQPGEQTRLVVTYDPDVHPGFVGKIRRIVYIKSNDPFQSEIELELVGVQK